MFTFRDGVALGFGAAVLLEEALRTWGERIAARRAVEDRAEVARLRAAIVEWAKSRDEGKVVNYGSARTAVYKTVPSERHVTAGDALLRIAGEKR